MQFFVSSILQPFTHYSQVIPPGMEETMLPGVATSTLKGEWGACCSQSIIRKDYTFWIHQFKIHSAMELFASAADKKMALLVVCTGKIGGAFSISEYQCCLVTIPGQVRQVLRFPAGNTLMVEIDVWLPMDVSPEKCTYLSRGCQIILQHLRRDFEAHAFRELYIDSIAASLLQEHLSQLKTHDETSLISNSPFHITPKDVEAARKAKAIIDASLTKKFSIRELAQLAGSNRFMLNRTFNYLFQQTIHQYWLSVSLQYAKQLVVSTGQPVKVIAALCGFEHYPHFIQQFRRYWGITPGEMRKTT